MAKNQKEERKIKQTNGSFKITGIINLGLDKFSEAKSESGFKYRRFSTTVNCGSSSPKIQCMGGFFPKNPNSINIWSDGAKSEIEWADRLDKTIVENLNRFSLISVGATKNENGKVQYKNFLSWWDAIEELKKMEDGSIVTVSGDIKFNTYENNKGEENTSYNLEVKSIYITDRQPEDFKATFTQNILIEKDFIDNSRLKEDKEVDANITILGYDSTLKMVRPFNYSMAIRVEDFPTIERFKKTIAFLNNKSDKVVKSVVVEGNIHGGSSKRKATLEDYDADILDFYDGDVDELLEEEIIDNGSMNLLTITAPKKFKDRDTNKQHFAIDLETWIKEDLIFTGIKEETVEDIDALIDDDDEDLLDGIEFDDDDLDLDLD